MHRYGTRSGSRDTRRYGTGSGSDLPNARSRSLPRPVPYRRVLLDALRGDEYQVCIADADLVVTLKRLRLGDLPPVDESAVAREIVFDQAPPVAVDDDRVRPADSFVLDQNVADGVGADPIVSGVNAEVFAVRVMAESDKPADDAPL